MVIAPSQLFEVILQAAIVLGFFLWMVSRMQGVPIGEMLASVRDYLTRKKEESELKEERYIEGGFNEFRR